MKTDSDLAALFAAFAHPSRIAILRRLLSCCDTGQTFGALAKDVRLAPSTLTHHLREMEEAGVLTREVAGRSSILRLETQMLEDAVDQLKALCCPAPTPQKALDQ